MRDRCRNPRCGDFLIDGPRIAFCPSCQWMARRALTIGGFLGGLLVALWRGLA